MVVIDAWSRYFVELLSRLICQLTISFHTLLCMTSQCHKTMKKYEDFEGMVISLLAPRKFAIQTWFCNCPQYFCLSHIVFECSPNFRDPGKMLVLPNRLLCLVVSTSDQDFVSFQPVLCHPHTQIRIILFHDVQRDIANLEYSPSHVSIGFSQIAFPIIAENNTSFFSQVFSKSFFLSLSSEFTFGDNSDKSSVSKNCMNLVDRDLTEHQITQTLTLSRLDAQLEQTRGLRLFSQTSYPSFVVFCPMQSDPCESVE